MKVHATSDEKHRDSSRSRVQKDDDISYGYDQNDDSESSYEQSRNSHAYDLSGDGVDRMDNYDPDRH